MKIKIKFLKKFTPSIYKEDLQNQRKKRNGKQLELIENEN